MNFFQQLIDFIKSMIETIKKLVGDIRKENDKKNYSLLKKELTPLKESAALCRLSFFVHLHFFANIVDKQQNA